MWLLCSFNGTRQPATRNRRYSRYITGLICRLASLYRCSLVSVATDIVWPNASWSGLYHFGYMGCTLYFARPTENVLKKLNIAWIYLV